MKKDQLYAIVDIEATGASIGRDERMIQFACVLFKNNQVIETFDTFVNPSRKVNKTIRDLTGISSKDLATAPYFEDIAHIIHALLEDSLFVAHNVAFDFHFLNECFERAGEKPLTIPAIDTVELAQILYPTEESYQLKELVGTLGYKLNNAHNALYDAQATTFLLQRLDEKLNRLPLITVESLFELSDSLTADTGVFIKHALEEMKEQPSDLAEDIIIIEGLALKKPGYLEGIENVREKPSYPFKEAEKEKVMADLGLHKRENQFSMMNEVFEYLKQESPNYAQFIEAAPGSGKTFGYLFPSVYLASKEKKIVLSTYTKVLQKQIVDEAIPLLNEHLPFKRTAALLKSVNHYMSLSAFYTKWKNVSKADIEAFFCMKILVWLTETSEGDLEELGVGTRLLHHFWQEIRSTYNLKPSSKNFEEYDYIYRRNKRVEHASILVTNHAYLLNEWRKQSDTPLSSTLILDEAHHVPDVIEESATVSFKSKRVTTALKKIGSTTKEDSLLCQLNELDSPHVKSYQLSTLESVAYVLSEEMDEWIAKWINWMRTTGQYDKKILEWKEESVNFSQVSMEIKRDTKFIKQNLSELTYVGNQLLQTLKSKELSKAEMKLVTKLKDEIALIEGEAELFDYVFFDRNDKSQTGVRFYSKNPTQTLSFMKYDQEKKEDMLDTLKKHAHVLLTSSTLAVNGSVRYMQKALDLQEAELSVFDSVYKYKDQGRLFVPIEDSIKATKSGLKPYASYLADQIETLVSQTDENCLVLFRSQEVIQEVYRLLSRRHSLQSKTILAQYVSGTPTKISKLFKKANQSIVLGSDSFWEGVDFPEDELKVVIITRLPFDSPEMPLVKKRHKELLNRGDNPFVHDLLPRAVVKFKQGIGRLIRSPKDKGVWVVLDRRMVDASYASVFLDSLPEDLKVEEKPIKEIAEDIQTFL